jgi:RHS repeat-associated protein
LRRLFIDERGDEWIDSYNLRFPGQYYRAQSGLFYNYFRDYDPQTGRYLESDPIGLAGGSYSTYAYVGGIPTSSVDPLGLEIDYANHVVSAGILHSFIIITPENQAAYADNPLFQNIDANGNRYAIIGAGPNAFLQLEAGINREHDVHDPIANKHRPCSYPANTKTRTRRLRLLCSWRLSTTTIRPSIHYSRRTGLVLHRGIIRTALFQD